jgi:NAD(P)-dependent dehydrogenase (short-subunit alcohol dehydrogenase family)
VILTALREGSKEQRASRSTPHPIPNERICSVSAGQGDLRNRVALVTGGGTGLGRTCALALAARGAAVAVNYARSREAAEETAGEIIAAGARAIAVRADIGDPAAVTSMVGEIEQALGPVELLVANAGITEYVPFAGQSQEGCRSEGSGAS